MNNDSLVSGDVGAFQTPTAAQVCDMINALAVAARMHGVMLNISVSPYELDVDDE